MNLGLGDELKLAFPNITPIHRPLVVNQVIKGPNWLVGFVDGEGCFNVNIINSKKYKIGTQVKVRFILTQHSRDLYLMKMLVEYQICGILNEKKKNPYIYLTVSKLSEINDKIIPLFNKYPLQSSKKLDFDDFCEVVELMKNKAHLTTEGLDKIREIQARMNRGRKGRDPASL